MKPTQNTSSKSTRRQFIRTTATAAAAVAATPLFKNTAYGQAPATGRVIGANDRITVGFIGVGGQGMNAHVRIMKSNASANNVALTSVCDVWTKRTGTAKDFIEKDNPGAKVTAHGDYRKLIEQKDIDAVVIATHDPIHADAIIAAVESGKHVYCEKPMTRYLDEALAVHDKVKATKKILQVGSQGCSAQAWHTAAKMINEGKIGQLVWAQGYYCRNNTKGEWNYPILEDFKADNADWEKWLGPVKKRIPFNPDHYFRWRKYYPYCAGLLGDLIPHRLLPLMLATGKPEFPSRVVCIGTKNVHTDKNTPDTPERDVPEHVQILVEFPSGVSLVLASSTVNARSPEFAIYGHHASLIIGNAGERIQILPEAPFADEIDPETFDGLKPVEDIGVHHKNWFDSIRANKQPNCGIDLAVRAQTVISLAEMSDRLKVACLFDEKTRKVTTADGKEVKPLTYGSTELS
ncbi:MAG: Gfo/Idh/MocA family oxidoreductase [Verrucomicrobia bacterium]|nr:Gfo/Idh/MocA family oxidoreductase [Verrucomicrobiota bacterium]